MADVTVAVFLVDRAYGGPEEGGWWYDAGAPDDDFARFTRGFKSEARAFAYQERLERHLCAKLNQGRPSIGSVLSRGEFRAVLCDGSPKPFPKERPTYE
jgi:hypothetical protein